MKVNHPGSGPLGRSGMSVPPFHDQSSLCDRFTTMATSGLCLTVALGSAMPTGDLHGTAVGLNTSNELIYLSITLFVVGFGVGPLVFAPRMSSQ
jgi:hypothetical protein